MEFRTAIVDELGWVMFWCSDLTEEEKLNILYDHPEWSIKCIEL